MVVQRRSKFGARIRQLHAVGLLGWILCAPGGLIPDVSARTLLAFEEAVENRFPGAGTERREIILDDDARARVEAAAGSKLSSSIVYSYDVVSGGETVAHLYLDRHRVRTLAEILLIAVTPDGTVHSIDVLAFSEPLEYLAKPAWYAAFEGRTLDRELKLGRGIDGITGATLTARATTEAVRRMLAVHAEVRGGAGAAPP